MKIGFLRFCRKPKITKSPRRWKHTTNNDTKDFSIDDNATKFNKKREEIGGRHNKVGRNQRLADDDDKKCEQYETGRTKMRRSYAEVTRRDEEKVRKDRDNCACPIPTQLSRVYLQQCEE